MRLDFQQCLWLTSEVVDSILMWKKSVLQIWCVAELLSYICKIFLLLNKVCEIVRCVARWKACSINRQTRRLLTSFRSIINRQDRSDIRTQCYRILFKYPLLHTITENAIFEGKKQMSQRYQTQVLYKLCIKTRSNPILQLISK